jgi:hypothetical protein
VKKKALTIAIVWTLLVAITAPAAYAAQGVITEVNPSGIGVALNASGGKVGAALENTPARGLLPYDTSVGTTGTD